MDKRKGLQGLLRDAQDERFDVVVINRLSRFGRNARDLLNNVEGLKDAGIQLRSIKEGIDFSTSYGKAMLTMLAAIAELEREVTSENVLENRRRIAEKGIPTEGNFPFARTFDRETGQWSLDEGKADAIRWAAHEFLDGGSLRKIAHVLKTEHGLPTAYVYLIKVLKERCGNKWETKFQTYDVPRILDDQTIEAVRKRLAFNATHKRNDTRKYALTGFLRCGPCGKCLGGQTQKGRLQYYKHPTNWGEKCKAFNSIRLEIIEPGYPQFSSELS